MITGNELGRTENEAFVGVHDHFIGKTEENNEKPESEQMERV
jgi:hypothetical protein